MNRLLAVVFVALFLVSSAARADEKPKERWYVLTMQGQRAGWMMSSEKTENGQITGTSQMELRIKRGPIEIPITMTTEFVETVDGKPVSMNMVQNLGAMAMTTSTIYKGDTIEITTGQGDQKVTSSKPAPTGEWYTPAAAERYVRDQLAKDAKEITLRTIDPSVGQVITVTRKVLDKTTVEVFGRTVPAVKWSSVVDKYKNIESVEYVDEAGETVKSETNVGGISLVQLAADKDLARSPMDPPELLMSTTVKPNRPIDNPRRVSYAVYTLTSTKDSITDLPSVVGQSVKRIDNTSLRVTQDASANEPLAGALADDVRKENLASVPMLKADDPEIVKLVERADVKALPPSKAAEKIRRFVHGYIQRKDMSVGFASASEVAKTKTGDCTEHAMLLSAMLRAAKIPSRVVSGLVYVDQFGGQEGIFGYHMWSQALVETDNGGSAWINLDATLPDSTPYDATHLILSTSSLAEGEMQNFLVQTAPIIGRLKIDVVTTK